MELTEVKVFKVTAEESDKGGEKLIGYFTDENVAKSAAHKAGWWDSDGEITQINLFKSEAGNYYTFSHVTDKVNPPVNVGEKLTDILKKLTPSEVAFLDQHFSK